MPSLEVEVFTKTKYFQNILDVFKYGKIIYVFNMRKYTRDIQKDTVERFFKEIIDDIYKPNRYIKYI